MTKAEAKAWKARWQLVSEYEKEELRRAPPELRLKQFSTLMGWARQLGWCDALREGEAEVRERWANLRRAYRAKKEYN
jgi:hypothetical protein